MPALGQRAQWERGEGRHSKPGKVDFMGKADKESRKVYLAAGEQPLLYMLLPCLYPKPKETSKVASRGAKQSNALSSFMDAFLGWAAKLPQKSALMPRDPGKDAQMEHMAHA